MDICAVSLFICLFIRTMFCMQITKVTWTSPSFSSLGINSCACIENTLQDQYIVSPFLSIRNSTSVTQAGCWLLDSLIKTADTRWMTKETGGMTVWLHLEPQLILQLTLTWSHPGFGWLKAQSSRYHGNKNLTNLFFNSHFEQILLTTHSTNKTLTSLLHIRQWLWR